MCVYGKQVLAILIILSFILYLQLNFILTINDIIHELFILILLNKFYLISEKDNEPNF